MGALKYLEKRGIGWNIIERYNLGYTEKEKVMSIDKISMAESIINDVPKALKRLKKDKGLIERTESSKTILTEDNKQLLVD